MAIDHIVFNLNSGIEGLAQSPAQSKSLEVLPQSQQVLPSSSIFTGAQIDLQKTPWMQATSRWEQAIQNFVTPRIDSSVLLPSELKTRLTSIRKKADTMARKNNSSALRALADALQDDADLQEMLHEYRSALIRA